ncbi:hypothetical protein REPUB_Repub07fG0097200 [Reevesia pubescens]
MDRDSDEEEQNNEDQSSYDDAELSATLTKEEKKKIRAKWNRTLIVKVFGKTVGYQHLLFKLNQLWKPQGKLFLIDLGSDFFLVKLQVSEDYDRIIKGGPWFVGGRFLTIRKRVPNFKASEAAFTSVATTGQYQLKDLDNRSTSQQKESSLLSDKQRGKLPLSEGNLKPAYQNRNSRPGNKIGIVNVKKIERSLAIQISEKALRIDGMVQENSSLSLKPPAASNQKLLVTKADTQSLNTLPTEILSFPTIFPFAPFLSKPSPSSTTPSPKPHGFSLEPKQVTVSLV